jgi:hypothetical protein
MFKLESNVTLETAKFIKTSLESQVNQLDNEIQTLVAKKHAFQFDLDKITQELAAYEPESSLLLPPPTHHNGNGKLVVLQEDDSLPKNYNKKWSLRQKMQFVIHKAEGPLTSEEIKTRLVKHEPDIELTNVSAYLSQGTKSGAFTKHFVNGAKPKYDVGTYLE